MPREGEPRLGATLPRLPRGRRVPDRCEEGGPPRRGGRVRGLPRRARRPRRRAAAVRDEGLRPRRRDRLLPRREARPARREVRVVPQDALLPEALAVVRHVSHGPARGIPRRLLRDLPLDGRRLQGDPPDVRPREDEVPAERSARPGGLREVPRERRLPRVEVRELRRLPPGPAPEGLRRGLLDVPRDGDFPDDEGRPREDRLPAPRPARRDPLRRVSQGAGREGTAEGGVVCDLPPGPSPGGVPTGLRDLPHREGLPRRPVRPRRQDPLPSHRTARDREVRGLSRPAGRRGSGGERPRAEGRRLSGSEGGVRGLPRGPSQGYARDGMRLVPRHGELPAEGLPAPPLPRALRRRPRGPRLREVSRRPDVRPERPAGPRR